MQPENVQTTDLGAFDRSTADAVVSVLRRRGCPAWADPASRGESLVRVPAHRRDEALALLAAHMEDVAALARAAEAGPPAAPPLPVAGTTPAGPVEPGEEPSESGPPIVLERLRRLGLGLAVVLAPLLVVTLAAPSLPLRSALVVFIAGLVAVTYWRNRQDD